jgi:hypothetical protein
MDIAVSGAYRKADCVTITTFSAVAVRADKVIKSLALVHLPAHLGAVQTAVSNQSHIHGGSARVTVRCNVQIGHYRRPLGGMVFVHTVICHKVVFRGRKELGH